jgi:mannosyltransferase OCH1-like enzyme
MIEKIIHYCWFGKGELPPLAKHCIESWKRYCPDYQIKEWNEDNFDLNLMDYIKQAYQKKKYAFVSDVARFYILEKCGGIYMDVDVELIRPIDEFLVNDCFVARQDDAKINPGLIIGSEAHHELLAEILKTYESSDFDEHKTIVDFTTEEMCLRGLSIKDENQKIKDIMVYRSEYFCPLSYQTGLLKKTSLTYSVHHFDGSWQSEFQKEKHNAYQKYISQYGALIGKLIWIVKYEGMKETIKKCFGI